MNLVDYKMGPQEALDAPRICIGSGDEPWLDGEVALEEGISVHTVQALRKLGHEARGQVRGVEKAAFGKGQLIIRDPESGVLSAGSDHRGDGMALAVVRVRNSR